MRCPEDLLALSAAGLLEAGEERQVREHVRECASCAARLEGFAELSMALGRMAAPVPPAYLAAKVAREIAEYADRRQGAWMASGVAVAGWVTGLAGWYVVGQVSSTAAAVWLVWSIGSGTIAVPVIAGVLRRRRGTA
jgi:predicted anti-sigma-YlaC factor YlaD